MKISRKQAGLGDSTRESQTGEITQDLLRADERSIGGRSSLARRMTRMNDYRGRRVRFAEGGGRVDGNCGVPFIRWRTRRIEARDNVNAFTRFRVSAAIS